MARARKTADSPEQAEQSEQEQREAAREEAGQANQDQENAPAVEQQPQPEGTPADSSYDENDAGRSGE